MLPLLARLSLYSLLLLNSLSVFADDAVILRRFEPDYAKAHKDLPLSVWLSVGQNDEYLVEDVQKLTNALKSRQYPSLRLQSTLIKDVNHLTGIQPTMLQAFKWAYCANVSPKN